MSRKAPTFIDQCISGDVMMDEVDEFVETWHTRPGTQDLHEDLGMTRSEYSLWVADPDVLPYIIKAHRESVSTASLLEQQLPLAARAASPRRAMALMAWLKANGKIE